MKKTIVITIAATLFATAAFAGPNPAVLMETSLGAVKIELYPDKAPGTVENFLGYVNSGFYNNTIFHRITPGAVIQGGAFSIDLKRKNTGAPIKNEAANGLRNEAGTVAMARTAAKDSATSQFFINVKDNPDYDYKAGNWLSTRDGYAVFGKVVEGMDVVKEIATGRSREPVTVISVQATE